MLLQRLLALISETQLDGATINSAERLRDHRRILTGKPMIREVFCEFHRAMMTLDENFFAGVSGLRIELGAGVCPMRDSYPSVLATDLVPDPGLDLVLDACAMDLDDRSVRALFGQNCFHHFPGVEQFFREVTRVVAPGGGVILIEPYYGPLAEVLFTRMFATESFDKKAAQWDAATDGPMSGANQALSYLVFVRDRQKFLERFPRLCIRYSAPLDNYLRYLLSGGLNFKQAVPDCMVGGVRRLEQWLKPLRRYLALHHVIVLQRQP